MHLLFLSYHAWPKKNRIGLPTFVILFHQRYQPGRRRLLATFLLLVFSSIILLQVHQFAQDYRQWLVMTA